ncbi:metallophosphoesterase family protein [Allopontixanthobacter sediminis]|uniref:Serine/threonine protein phosphatase n=1 Tax=Allopontixanthobacter sediminis TaxID=1689985 RepID=A0A845BC10_9SPHN|nr:metallophosphoesterase family protein [Allopontixanthobacter sediminis]MXP45099.1 serine/threonine protein phosphatase [Allopontixanthobacter sediminis]
MFEYFRQFFRSKPSGPAARLPEGQRAYVVGDIHGRLDLFEELVAAIERDDRDAGPAETTIILLGDLVDRGPDSAGVIDRARRLQASRNVRILAGNHEEMFLQAFNNVNMLRHFLKHGGRETVLSYGVDLQSYNGASLEELQAIMVRYVPEADRQFVQSFEEYLTLGDYAFVHAGINPEVPLEDQTRQDLLWIRDPFLGFSGAHSHVIVHGHTIVEKVEERDNRIGIDTGAYRFGRLTALVLEGAERRYIQAVQREGSVSSEHLPVAA